MVVAGVLPSAWVAHSPQTKQLTIGGLDVWNKPGAYGVPVDSVVLAEAGPGAISALDFTIDDPGSLVVLAEGQEVIFTDLVSGLDRKSTRLNSSHVTTSRMPSSA